MKQASAPAEEGGFPGTQKDGVGYSSTTHLGKLAIKAIEAKLLIDTELFGKMDPFLEVEWMGSKFKTPVHQDGGKLPVWNHKFPDILILKEI